MICAVIFDMDGLLLDSEIYWERARRKYVASLGRVWTAEDELMAKGMNSMEWARLIQERAGVSELAEDIIAGVSRYMRDLYDDHLPLLPGATETVRELAGRYPLGLASSSPPDLIEFALSEAGVWECFSAVVSSDQVGKGKPNPDVFLATASKLEIEPVQIAVFEDSSSGISAAHTAGMWVIAVPNPHFPPTSEALALAGIVLPSLDAFSPKMLERVTN